MLPHSSPDGKRASARCSTPRQVGGLRIDSSIEVSWRQHTDKIPDEAPTMSLIGFPESLKIYQSMMVIGNSPLITRTNSFGATE